MIFAKICFILWIIGIVFVFFKEDDDILNKLLSSVAFAVFSAMFFAIIVLVGGNLFGFI